MKNLSVLIIEEDQLFRHKLKSWVKNIILQVESCASVSEGPQLASALKPDLIFLDELKGCELIAVLKKKSPNSKIILMSAAADVEQVAEAIQQKSDYLFNKNQITQTELQLILEAGKKAKDKNASIWKVLKKIPSLKPKSDKQNIAVIDDDELFSFNLCWKLNKSAREHTVNSFSEGKSFLKFLENSSPDLVFLDYFLPDVNGQKLLEIINKRSPQTKVIIISAQENAQLALELSHANIYGYIVKKGGWKLKLEQYFNELNL
jgi:DNA-binding NtrC family response regulator